MDIHNKPIQQRIEWLLDHAQRHHGAEMHGRINISVATNTRARARAELKSRFLSQFAAGVIRKEFPELAGKMFGRVAVLDWRSRALEMIGAGEC